jgi:hypothetical protein
VRPNRIDGVPVGVLLIVDVGLWLVVDVGEFVGQSAIPITP